MVENKNIKELRWVGNSRKCILKFPIDVKKTFGHALYVAQMGDRSLHTKMMKGLGAGIYEIIEDHKSDRKCNIAGVNLEFKVL